MEFGSLDLFDDEEGEEGEEKEDLALKARMLYTPRICSTDPWNNCLPQDDENGKKMLADRHYYRLEYAAALEMYKELLEGKTCKASVALKRDLTECIARSCLALGDFKNAWQHALDFHAASPDHPDHRSVGLALLIDVSRARVADKSTATTTDERAHLALLANMVELQPSLPRFWCWLAEHYRGEEEGGRKKEAACLLRARDLLATHLATANRTSFLTCRNAETLKDVEERLAVVSPEVGDLREIQDKVCGDIRRRGGVSDGKVEETQNGGEFEDLGRSVRLKGIEEVLAQENGNTVTNVNDDSVILKFEEKWF